MSGRLRGVLAIATCVLLLQAGTGLGSEIDRNLSRLINQGQIEEARQMLERSAPSETDRLFFAARILKTQQRFDEALAGFRQVLERDPGHINAKRELAHTLLLMNRLDAAEFQFRELLEIDRNETMRDGYAKFLDIIDRSRPFGITGHVALLPSTNVNGGTYNAFFDTGLGRFVIDPQSRARSGVGLETGASVFFRQSLGPRSRFVLSAAGTGKFYQNAAYNDLTGTVSASYQQLTKAGSWAVTPYLRQSERRDHGDHRATGFQIAFGHRISKRIDLTISAAYERRFYPERSHLDGPFATTTGLFTWHIDPTLAISAGLGLETHRPQSQHLRYTGTRLIGEISKNWRGGFETALGVQLGERRYSADFPLMGEPRNDRFYVVSGTVANARIDFQGFTPSLTCSYAETASNVSLYDRRSADCNIGITKRF